MMSWHAALIALNLGAAACNVCVVVLRRRHNLSLWEANALAGVANVLMVVWLLFDIAMRSRVTP